MKLTKVLSVLIPVVLILLSIISFFLFKDVFLTTIEQASILAIIPLVLAVILLRARDEVAIYLETFIAEFKKSDAFFISLSAIALITVYVSIVAIIILGNPIIVRDEWRHFNDYLFRKDLFHSIFDRQNGHLIVTTNILYLINYHLFSGKEIWLHLYNIIFISMGATVIVTVFYEAISMRLRKSTMIACCSVLTLCWWWLAGGLSMFWALGLHNNLAILGTIVSAYGLSKYGINSIVGISLFFFGAVFASISFSAGLATWGLGLVIVILRKGGWKKIVASTLLSIVGVGGIVGFYLFEKGGIKGMTKTGDFDFSAIEFFKFIPAFLGAPFTQFFYTDIDTTSLMLPYIAFVIGMFSIIFFAFQVGFYFKKKNNLSIVSSRSLHFFFLMIAFVIGCSILFALGRAEGSFANALAWRFHSWGVVYWCSLLASTIIIYSSLEQIYSKKILGCFLGFVLIGLVGYNTIRIEVRLYENNRMIPAIVDLMVNPNEQGNEKNLWNPAVLSFPKIINRVSDSLKSDRKNIYVEPWTHLMGKRFSTTFLKQKESTLNAFFTFKSLESENDMTIEGWIAGGKKTYLSPSKIVFVLNDKIIGIGIPSTDRKLQEPYKKPMRLTSISNLFHLLPRPFCNWSGVSNYFYGQLYLEDKTLQEEVGIFGIYNDGEYARIQL